MARSKAALVDALYKLFTSKELLELLRTILNVVWSVVVPFLVVLVSILWILQEALPYIRNKFHIFPESSKVRYQRAKKRYQRGQIDLALQEWSDLKTYSPAYLSRACHEIYIQKNIPKGMAILGQLQTILEKQKQRTTGSQLRHPSDDRLEKWNILEQEIQSMRYDAGAYQSGNDIMVSLNAQLAKLEHLGIGTKSNKSKDMFSIRSMVDSAMQKPIPSKDKDA